MSRAEAGKLGFQKAKSTIEKQKQGRIDTYNLTPSYCNFCGNSLNYKKRHNKYCNSTCSAKASNLQRKQKPTATAIIQKVSTCLFCKKNNLSRGSKKYCGYVCYNKHDWEIRKAKFEHTGIINAGRRVIKRYLLEKQGHICSICKNTKWESKPIPLIVDHINGNPYDDKIINLRLVCGNCDMQLPTYKAKNKGNGRKARRERYHKDKKSTKSFCVDCKTEVHKTSKRCRDCHGKYATKINWPPIEDLKKMVSESSVHAVSKKLDVAFNSVKKRLNKHESKT